MLKYTFCHVPGIGLKTEEQLWASGLHEWKEVFALSAGQPPFSKGRIKTLRYHIERSMDRLEADDPSYFAQGLPTHEHWRLFPDFRKSIAYLDIETTGMGDLNDYITAISLYDGRSISSYVYDDNLLQFRDDIQNYDVIVTYNGKSFDVPFIRDHLKIPMNQVHIDLRYVLKSLGYRGGLKGCEKQMGIDRGDLNGIDGFFAVLLWQDYRSNGNLKALDTLLAYNIEDVVNLEALMVMAYNQKIKTTPFHQDLTLPLPGSPPPIPYKADLETIERMRKRLQTIQFG